MKKFISLQNTAVLLFLVWCGFYIYRSSFIAIDGQRYFSLFDDAMISMRYAWNLSHGNGLVWNVGEYVEGYTNLLMTLVMVPVTALFNKKDAVLVMQILGIPTCLCAAFLTREIAHNFYAGNRWVGKLAFIGILFYFPLSFWSLLGMETGLLTVWMLAAFLCALKWRDERTPRHLWGMAVFLGLAFLTRNDALIAAFIIFSFVFAVWIRSRDPAQLKLIIFAGLLLGAFVAGQELFRLGYYGELLPNTYTLKVSGVPLLARLSWGLEFITPFLLQSALILVISMAEVVHLRFRNIVFWMFIAAAILYQVSVGGDAWREWRMLAPAMPFLFILLAAFAVVGGEWVASRLLSHSSAWAAGLAFALVFVNLWVLDVPFRQYFDTSVVDIESSVNGHNVNVAIGLQNLINKDATIGVTWAGVIPYYSDLKAIDFLGKSDKYIASLPAHLDFSLPGHNKFDLAYSIRKLQPTYIQDFEWGKENLRPWVIKNYLRVNYSTPLGDITVILRRNDPSVNWAKGKIIPWPEDAAP